MASSVVFVPEPGTSAKLATGAASAQFALTLTVDGYYMLSVEAASYIKQGTLASNPVASAGAGSMLVTPNAPVLLFGGHGDTVAIIQATGAGGATLQKMTRMVG